MDQLPAEGFSLGGAGLLKWTGPSQSTTLHFSSWWWLGSTWGVASALWPVVIYGWKPQAADASIMPCAGPKVKYMFVEEEKYEKPSSWQVCKYTGRETLIPTLSRAVTRVRIPTSRSVSVSVGVIGLLSKHEGQVGLQLSVSDKVEEKWRNEQDLTRNPRSGRMKPFDGSCLDCLGKCLAKATDGLTGVWRSTGFRGFNYTMVRF